MCTLCANPEKTQTKENNPTQQAQNLRYQMNFFTSKIKDAQAKGPLWPLLPARAMTTSVSELWLGKGSLPKWEGGSEGWLC